MAITASSLEDYIKNYRYKKAMLNRPKTLEEYMVSKGVDPESKYEKTMLAALNERAASGGGYGALGESVGSAGLATSGYRQHLERLAEKSLADTLDVADEVRLGEYAMARQDYEGYLDGYNDDQIKVKDKLTKYFIKNTIYRLEDTFAIGIEQGLSAEEAANLSAQMYGMLRNRVKNECLAALSTAALDLEGIKRYAERSGLLEEDVKDLIEEATPYAINRDIASDEYLEKLEELSSKH